jgi:hypothetical protein
MNAQYPKYRGIKQNMHIYYEGHIRFGVHTHSIDDGFRREVFYKQLKPTKSGRIEEIREGAVSVISGGDPLPLIIQECIAFDSRERKPAKTA